MYVCMYVCIKANSKLMLKECEAKWGNGLVNSNKPMDLMAKRGK